MKGYWIRTEGGAMRLELRDVPRPEPGEGQVGLRIRAAALNRGELIAGHGLHAASTQARPAGFEAAGEVEALGAGVTGLRVGDRVMGRCDGAFAEYGCMHEREAHVVPAALNWEQGACTTVAYGTAHDALMAQGRLQAGEWVLIAGVSSGVGIAVLQVAKALGARVIGTSGSSEKLARAQALGLDVALHTRGSGVAEATLEATQGRGADLAVNNIGGSVFAACVDALAFEGRMATVGYVDGVIRAEIDILALHKKRLHLFGVSTKLRTLQHRAEAARRFAEDLMSYFADGRIAPVIDRVYPFARLEEAQKDMETNRQVGKLVLKMD